MKGVVSKYLSEVEFGELQQFESMAVLPISAHGGNGAEFLTLGEALKAGSLTIEEIGEHGSVPELNALNNGDVAVLILEGEEVSGAKQNRILNTSILLRGRSRTVIPVSCTEHGRWTRVSAHFGESGGIASPSLRAIQTGTVSDNLEEARSFRSDQGAVWTQIESMSVSAGVRSDTNAMKDVYDAKSEGLDEYVRSFKWRPGQNGLLVFINGEVGGFDVFSSERACEKLYGKLVRSYAMEALLGAGGKAKEPSVQTARDFVDSARSCRERVHRSTGHGWDHRFTGSGIVGFGLVHRRQVVHTAFFRKVGEACGN